MICANCGQHLHDRAVFCDNCGFRLDASQRHSAEGKMATSRVGGRAGETLLSLVLSMLALAVLFCLYLKWLVLLKYEDPFYNSYTLLQLAETMSASLAVGDISVVLANLLRVAILLDTALWLAFIWQIVRRSFLRRVFSQLAGATTIILVVATSLVVTMLNSEGFDFVYDVDSYRSASMSLAPFLAASFSMLLIVMVTMGQPRYRRVGRGRLRPGGALDGDGDSVVSSLVDLDVLLDDGKPGPAAFARAAALDAGVAGSRAYDEPQEAAAMLSDEGQRPEGKFYGMAGTPQNKKCASCGASNSEHNIFCAKCGVAFGAEAPERACGRCGAPVGGDDSFCANCGLGLAVVVPQHGGLSEECPDGKHPCPDCGALIEDLAGYCWECGSVFGV